MDESYVRAPLGTTRLNLLIADCFTGNTQPIFTEIEVETQTDGRNGALWVVSLQDGKLEKFLYKDIGYWVRQAVLFTKEQAAHIQCRVGFSPESGKFLKLLERSAQGGLSVWMESGPVTHILRIEP
jgi:hypothetical protein